MLVFFFLFFLLDSCFYLLFFIVQFSSYLIVFRERWALTGEICLPINSISVMFSRCLHLLWLVTKSLNYLPWYWLLHWKYVYHQDDFGLRNLPNYSRISFKNRFRINNPGTWRLVIINLDYYLNKTNILLNW